MTSDSMEVDPPSGGGGSATEAGDGAGQAQEKTLKVHPLALIGISDHHTRVVTGGSALPPTAPVMGLLFGYQDGLTVSILDAEEMEYSFADPPPSSSSEAGFGGFGGGTEEQQSQHRSVLRTKIDLHRKVFPAHEVIGWYRVGNDADSGPTEEDLRMNNGPMREYNESPLFVLMNAGHGARQQPSPEEDRKPSAAGAGSSVSGSSTAGQEARDKLDRDEQLPLSVYETLVTVGAGDGDDAAAEAQPRAVFVNLEFELETSEPERIAVEKVFKTQPSVAAATAKAAAAATGGLKAGGGEGDGDGGGPDAPPSAPGGRPSSAPPPAPVPASGLDVHLQSMRDSIESMNDRVEILLDFLRRTHSGDIPPDYNLLRQVDGLVRQLPLVRVGSDSAGLGREFENEYDDMLVLSYLAAVAKTARAVQTYSDKFRIVQDSSNRDVMRRAY